MLVNWDCYHSSGSHPIKSWTWKGARELEIRVRATWKKPDRTRPRCSASAIAMRPPWLHQAWATREADGQRHWPLPSPISSRSTPWQLQVASASASGTDCDRQINYGFHWQWWHDGHWPIGNVTSTWGCQWKKWGGGSPQLYHDCSGRIPGHTTRAPPVGFELETNGFRFYATVFFPF